MEKGKISFNQKYVARVIASIAVYALFAWFIYMRVIKDYGFMAQQSLVKQSVNGYLGGVIGCLIAAGVINIIWWWLALNTSNIRQSFERNAIIYAAILGVILFIMIIIIESKYGKVVDDLGHENSLRYAYSVGCGFLINVFGFPPQTVRDVLLPGGIWGRILVVIIAAVIAIGILR